MKESLLLYFWFIKQLVSPRYLPLYLAAMLSTYILVQSGIDWQYFVFVYHSDLQWLLYIADVIGFLLALIIPLLLYGIAKITKHAIYRIYSAATMYCVLLGFTISTGIKMFTGRTSPPHFHHGEKEILIDNSDAFNFGFMREQIIGGWPSSHTTIMTALAVSACLILPISWWYKLLIIGIALFVGIGVTLGFHWLSEFVAGALLGSAIGILVGSYYRSIVKFGQSRM